MQLLYYNSNYHIIIFYFITNLDELEMTEASSGNVKVEGKMDYNDQIQDDIRRIV